MLGQQQPYQYMQEDGLTLSHPSNISVLTNSRRWTIFFDTETLQMEEYGAIEFYNIKFYLRNHHSQIQHWSDDRWKASLAAGGGSNRRYQYCSDNLGTSIYLRALQGRSGNNLKIERGNPWNQAHTHTVQEVLPDIVILYHQNAHKFHLAIDDENIDFNISGVPNAMVKRSHGINVHNLIQKIENHSQRQALESNLQQHRAFNPYSKESKDAIMAAGNTELCEIIDVEPKSQCRACLTHWSAGVVYCTCGHFMKDDTTENKKYISSVLDLFSIPNFYIRKGRPHGHRYGRKHKDAKSTKRHISFKRGVARRNMTTFTIASSATSSSEKR